MDQLREAIIIEEAATYILSNPLHKLYRPPSTTHRAMNNIPGGFPGMYDAGTGIPSIEQDPAAHNLPQAVRSTPEFDAIKKSLKARKKVWKKHMINSIDMTTYIFIFITYLYDCSLLLLILRASVQSIILVFQFSPILQQIIPKNAGKRSTFHIVVISNFCAVLIHLTRELPTPNDDGFIYGHHTLQSIGQTQLPNKWLFIPLDLLVFYLQIVLFTSQYSPKKNKTMRSSLVEREYDGFQGETIAMKIPIISALHMPFPRVEVLKSEEEEMENHLQNSQLNDPDFLTSQALYGSIAVNEADEDDTPNAIF